MKRDYLLFLSDISYRIEKINSFVKDMEFEQFRQDEKTVSATIREIEVIGEAAKQIPASVRESFNDLPWSLMAKMRDKLIHWYFEIDEEIVWKVVKEKLPDIKIKIDAMLKILRD